jgi:transcriptional regulator with XRE-family HTH domain
MKEKKMSITETKRISTEEMEEAKRLSAHDLGMKVTELRKKRAHLNQEELAVIIGTVQSAISEIENGVYPSITMDLISRLSIALDVSPLELAAAYWGVTETELTKVELGLVNDMVKLIEQYKIDRQKTRIHHLPPSNPMLTNPNHEKELTVGDQAADEVIQEQEKETEKTKPKKLPHISGRKKGRPSSNPKD